MKILPWLALCAAVCVPSIAAADPDFDIRLDTVRRGYDGATCWVHPRAGLIPRQGASPSIVMTMMKLKVTGSDVFLPVNDLRTDDLGRNWSEPIERAEAFGRRAEPNGVECGVCDFTPAWHAQTGKLLAIGHTVRYKADKVVKERPRETCWSAYDADQRSWSPWKIMEMPDEPRFYNCGAGSAQRLDLPDGSILLPVYHRSKGEADYKVSVARCEFDGESLKFRAIGNELTVSGGRGLYEPSLARFRGKYYATMRNDDAAYVATSADGLRFDPPQPWLWDDGTPLGSYNTQQHWATHSEGLFLVYTRKGANNDHVFRHRAPLFIARVDPERLRVIRATERVLIPERGARLGNFGVALVSPEETWVTVAEWMQTWPPNIVIPKDNPRGADNSVYVARIRWRDPNAEFAAGDASPNPDRERTRWERLESGVRVFVNELVSAKPKPKLLLIYATPNGNSVEQTLGCAPSQDRDWRFDIQHVAAQSRALRQADPDRDLALAVVQAPKLSWPAFRREQAGAEAIIRDLVARLKRETNADRIALTGHSGGGSMIFGYLNAVATIPDEVERIVLLDANYAYSDADRHGDKLTAWLKGDRARHLIVIAYDDREIRLNGKKVVGPDGGTFRASHRMIERLRRDLTLDESDEGPFRRFAGSDGQVQFFIHPNPGNQILHTALVGEMNGLLQGMMLGRDRFSAAVRPWGSFGGPRAYSRWIPAEPFVEAAQPKPKAIIAPDVPEVRLPLPDRPPGALTGSQFRDRIAAMPRPEREQAIRDEILRGNVPAFLRSLVPIRAEGAAPDGVKLTAVYHATRDYLAVGSDEDFFRLPMNPSTATAIADVLKCSLITAKISDDLFQASTLKLDPQPLVKDRESVLTFFDHHRRIEDQILAKAQTSGFKPSPARSGLIAGIKKDIVLSRRLKEKPHKVAIYGWHHPDGKPIQPVYAGHVDWYVDYSHGVRLIADRVRVGDQDFRLSEALRDPRQHVLFSDEGPLDPQELRKAAGWQAQAQ